MKMDAEVWDRGRWTQMQVDYPPPELLMIPDDPGPVTPVTAHSSPFASAFQVRRFRLDSVAHRCAFYFPDA